MRRFRVDVPFGLSLTLRTDVPGELAVEYGPDHTAHARALAAQGEVPVQVQVQVHGDDHDRPLVLPDHAPPSPRPLSPIGVDASDSDDMEWAVLAEVSGVSPARTATSEWAPESESDHDHDHPMQLHMHTMLDNLYRPREEGEGEPHHHPFPVALEMAGFEPRYTMYRLSPSPPPPPQLNIPDFEFGFDDAAYTHLSPSPSPRLRHHTPDFDFDDTHEHQEYQEHQLQPLIINTSDTLDLDPTSTPPPPPHHQHQLFPAPLPSPTDTEPIEPIYAPPSSPQATWLARLLAAHNIAAIDYAFPPYSARLPAPTLFDPSLALHAYLTHAGTHPLQARRLWSLGWLTAAEARAAVHPRLRAGLSPLFRAGEPGARWVPLRDAEPPRGWTWGRQRAFVGARVRERYAHPPAPAPRLKRRHSVDCDARAAREMWAWAPAKRRRLSPESDAGGYHEFRQRAGVRVQSVDADADAGLMSMPMSLPMPEGGGAQDVQGVQGQGGPADAVDTPPPSPGGVPPDAPAVRVVRGLPLRRTETLMRL